MLEITYQRESGARERVVANKATCTIGSARGNDIVLASKRIAAAHARVTRLAQGARIEDLGTMSGTWVNQERVVAFEPLTAIDEIVIGEYRIWVTNGPDARTDSQPAPRQTPAAVSPDATRAAAPTSPETLTWRRFVHDRLIEQMDLRRKDVHRMSDDALRAETEALIREILARHEREIPRTLDRTLLLNDVINEAVGLGPLERLLAEDDVTEIMVNRADEIFVERDGRLEHSHCVFSNDAAVLGVIERIITPLGRRIDESMPMVDARLRDGSRVNAIIPPLAIKGPSITIRKFAKRRLITDDLVTYGSISAQMVEFLRVCVERRRNVIVSGGTGSGKTTLLNVLSNFIPPHERVVTIEDAAELRLHQANLVSLEARPANIEGKGAVAIRDLVRNSLRMRPDRIVVGECRGGEALDMLQAMNTGHDGSLTTLHANTPRDALARLEVMVLMAGMDLPVSAIREQVASAVNVIVQQTRFACGARKVTHVTEVAGIESGKIQLQDIFVFDNHGLGAGGRTQGNFRGCGFVPGFYESLARAGVPLDLSIFGKGREA